MPTKTHHSKAALNDGENVSAQWIYDTLMEEIEPDLTSENIVELDRKYSEETADEHMERMKRYEYAFVVLNECIEDLKVDADMESLIHPQMLDPFALAA